MGNPAKSGWAAGPSAPARRRDSQPRTSREGGAANETRGGSAHRASLGPVAARIAIRGLYFFDGGLRKKIQFEPVKQTRAKLSRSLALAHRPGTTPRACLLPRRASGPRRPAPTFLPPAAGRTSRCASGRGRPSGTETPISNLPGGLGQGSDPESLPPVPLARPNCSPVPTSQVARVAVDAVR